MERDSLDVLGQRVLLGDPVGPYYARHGLSLRHPLLLDQELERSVTTSAGWHLVPAGLGAVRVEHQSDTEALKQRAPAMSSASSSIETPALTRRTLAETE